MNLFAMRLAGRGKPHGVAGGELSSARARLRFGVGLLLVAQVFLTGCLVGPDYHRPEDKTIPAAYTVATIDTFDTNSLWKVAEPQGELPKGNWWEMFGDPELNDLETQAAHANPQLKAAVNRFDEARAQMDITRAGLFPSVDVAANGVRQRISPNQPSVITGAPVGFKATFSDYTLPLDFTYEVDIWGSVRRSVEFSRDQAQATADELATVNLDIQAEVAMDYFGLRAFDSELAVLRSSIYVFNRAYDLTVDQRHGGIATDLEVAQAQTVLRTTEAQLPSVMLQRAQMEHALAVLAGQPAPTFHIPEQILTIAPPLIPSGLPSQLLERRPDISTAERFMAAANANIGVAKAAFFPTVQFNGLGGLQSISFGSLMNASSRIWAVGPTITLPIFEGGRLRAGFRLAKATYEEMVNNYRQSVLFAFSDVEDSLAAQSLLAIQYGAESDALLAARKQLELANIQFRDGLITFLDVATAESTELNVEFSTVQIRGQQLVATVSLIKALGGGWQEPKNQ